MHAAVTTSSTTHRYGVDLEATARAEGHTALGRTHRAGGHSLPRDLADYVFQDARRETNKEDADLVQGKTFMFAIYLAIFMCSGNK